MNATALRVDGSQVFQEIGEVAAIEGTEFRVATTAGLYTAKRAFGCLVLPEPGDRVLVASTSSGQAFILSVLERKGDATATIGADGDLDIRLADGRLRLVAKDGIDAVTTAAMRLVSGELELNAKSAKAVVGALAFVGKSAALSVEGVKGVFGLVDHVADRISQQVKRSYRFVEELDVTRAKHIDVRAEDNVHVRGKNTLVSAEVLVKMDAEQIHLG
ncbi:MAG: DUF3540 domain-containing protein [Sandaracinaceae bacterium]